MLPSTYEIQTAVLCPSDLGWPVGRMRRYTIASLARMWCWKREYSRESLSEIAFEKVSQDGSIFFVASPSQEDDYKATLAEQRHLPRTKRDGRMWSWSAVLPDGDFRRLTGYLKMLDGENYFEQHSIAIINMAQDAEYVKVAHDVVPALLRQSSLCMLLPKSAARERSSERIRPALAEEQLLMQGWCVPDLLGPLGLETVSAELFYWREALQTMHHRQVRHVAGNGMHVAVVGTVILHWLLFCGVIE